MQNDAGLNVKAFAGLGVASFAQCILELVANSLDARATAVAIRVHTGKREIQVIDNGVGIQRDALERVGEYSAESANDRPQMCTSNESSDHMLANIRRLSDALTVTSRYQRSTETFMKTFRIGYTPDLAQIDQRASQGTTVCVYGFYEIPRRKNWDLSTVCFLVAVIAATKLEVSFSIRDEERKKVVLRIAKPHNSIKVLRILFGKKLLSNCVWSIQCDTKCDAKYHGYVGLSDESAIQCIFLNHRLIRCPLILKLIRVGLEENLDLSLYQTLDTQDSRNKNMFILFFLTFSQEEYTFVNENGKRYVIFYHMQKILNNIKNCVFKCLAEKTICDSTSYLSKTRLLKQIRVKSERPVFNDSINEHKNITPLNEKHKIVVVGFKRRKITSGIVTDYFIKRNSESDTDVRTINYVEKENDTANNTQSINFSKCTRLCKDRITERTCDNIDEVETNDIKFALANNFNKSDNRCDNNQNDNSVKMITPLSEWSNWTYHTVSDKHKAAVNVDDTVSRNALRLQRFLKCTEQFDFLPRKLHGFLQHRRAKLTNVKCFNSPNSTISFKGSWQHEEIEIHPCNLKQRLCEFRLSHDSLRCIKVINQINKEFIAAWMTYNEMKILLMIDQHAVHERIRYENLFLRYKVENEDGLLSINLRNPLVVELSIKKCNLLLCNKALLKKYGISLGSLKENALSIRAIPQCLVTSNDHYLNEKILSRIHTLLNDILENRNTANRANTLPLTIHNAIASEACHGAIKFGDKLTFEQCTRLMKSLRHTKFPNRCAHGRPTIIPVIELSELEKRSARMPEKKLNFSALKIHH